MSVSLSKSEWDHWCNEFDDSHQTKIGFCRDNNLNYHQFLYWFEKYNKTSAKLIPVKIANPRQPLARLRLGNGCSLEIMSQVALTIITLIERAHKLPEISEYAYTLKFFLGSGCYLVFFEPLFSS